MSDILLPLIFSLVLTLAVELPLALLLKVRRVKDLLVIALVNILTNPVVNFCYYAAILLFSEYSVITYIILAVLEIAAVIVEFLFYRRLLSYDRIGKLKLSIILNSASFLAGLLLTVILKAITSS